MNQRKEPYIYKGTTNTTYYKVPSDVINVIIYASVTDIHDSTFQNRHSLHCNMRRHHY
jgi:hypothetical protein